MANVIYPKCKNKFLNPTTLGAGSGTSVDLKDDTIKIVLIDVGNYTYSSSHEFFSSVPGSAIVSSAVTLTNKRVGSADGLADGVFDADNVTFASVTGNSIEALIIYKDTTGSGGSDSTSPLIAYIDTATGLSPTGIVPNGGNITVEFNASGIFAL